MAFDDKNARLETNRLINEKSPYLLQHAHNPVDWHPWNDEAFERARLENKPVLVSIGYSTCHWCHVMEKEVFEDASAAAVMNASFISIKVDREERPDLDHIYMTAAQMLTGGGGWPLNVFLTPDKKPFYAATYIPKLTSQSSIGMMDLAPRLLSIWQEKQEEVIASAERVAAALSALAITAANDGWQGPTDGLEALDAAFEGLEIAFDDANGGFGAPPKFPSPHNLSFLLRYHKRTGNETALRMVEETLTKMRLGGIFDQIGGGFHRYSIDSRWFLPHFEKLLYDQALITIACAEAYRVIGNELYKDIAKATCDYVLRDLTSPQGAFFCGEDADSESEEGKFYLWTEAEIDAALDKDDAQLAKLFYNVSGQGNFIDEVLGEYAGANVLTGKDLAQTAAMLKITIGELSSKLRNISEELLKARARKVRPMRDEKILLDWNGLMIAGLAISSSAFDEPAYCKAAARAADSLLKTMRPTETKKSKKLFHRMKDSDVSIDAFLDDYAFMAWGLLELHQATFDERYLAEAIGITEIAIKEFADVERGGFFFTSERAQDVIVRQKQIHDGAMPSGYSIMALNLLRLGQMTGRRDFEEMGIKAIGVLMNAVKEHPLAFTSLLSAVDFATGPTFELVISGKAGEPDTEEMIRIIRRGFYPRGVAMLSPGRPDANQATAYLCINKTCEEPITKPAALSERLKSIYQQIDETTGRVRTEGL